MAWPVIAVSVGLSLLNAGISYYLARQRREEEDFDLRFSEGSIPVAEEGSPIPVIFGTVRSRKPNVVWWDFVGTDIGVHCVWCHGPVDMVGPIYIGEINLEAVELSDPFDLGSPPVTEWDLSSGPVNIDGAEPWIREPGSTFRYTIADYPFVLHGDLEPGLPAQTRNSRLQSLQGNGPAYRSVFGMVLVLRLRGAERLPPISAVIKRTDVRSFGDTQWLVAEADIDGAINPVHIIREAITDTQWGMGKPESIIDDTSFQAVAEALSAEGFGLSLFWDTRRPAEDLIVEVLRHIDGAIYTEPTTGLVTLSLIRDDYDAATLPVIGPGQIVGAPSSSRPSPSELVNEIVLQFSTLESTTPRSIIVNDPLGQALYGPVTHTVSYPLIYDEALAGRVASRDLQQLSVALRNIEMRVPPSVADDLRPGDPFVFSYPDWGVTTVLRVIKMTDADPAASDPSVRLLCLEDVFAYGSAVTIDIEPIDPTPILPPTPPNQEGLEMPYWMAYEFRRQFVDGQALPSSLLTESRGQAGLVADSPQDNAVAWDFYVDQALRHESVGLSTETRLLFDTTGFNVESSDVTVFPARPLEPLAGEFPLIYLPDLDGGYDDDEAQVYGGPAPGIVVLREYDPEAGTAIAELGIFDTRAPIDLQEISDGWLLGYVTWSNAPTVRLTCGIDPQFQPNGVNVPLQSVLRTLTDVGVAADSDDEEVTIIRRAERAIAPGRCRIDATNDNPPDADGFLTITARSRNRAGVQRFQSDDTDTGAESGTDYLYTFWHVDTSTKKLTFLRGEFAATLTYQYDNFDEALDANAAGFPRAVCDVLAVAIQARRDTDGDLASIYPVMRVLDRT